MSISPILGRVLAIVVLTAVLAGCKGSPTEPEHDSLPPQLNLFCLPLGASVTCKAYLDGADVTSAATWIASDPAVGDFLEPGLFTPKRRGEVELSARHGALMPRVTPRFLVDPLQRARPLSFLAGIVRDDETNKELPGAMVEVLDGYARGSTSVANPYGHYQIDKILTEETFSVRAEMPGYVPLTLTYRVDPSAYQLEPGDTAPRNPPFLDFRLRRSG